MHNLSNIIRKVDYTVMKYRRFFVQYVFLAILYYIWIFLRILEFRKAVLLKLNHYTNPMSWKGNLGSRLIFGIGVLVINSLLVL